MKELSIEEKAKAYDQAIEIIKGNLDALNEIIETGAEVVNIQSIKNCFCRAFPELKESKDERIKEDLIQWIDEFPDTIWRGHYKKDIIAWLENQGDKDNQLKLPTFTFDDILALQCCMETVKKVQEDKDLYEKLDDLHGRVYDVYHLEKQGEQKPTNSYCQENCRGFQQTGRCFCDGECKAKREAESIDKVEPKFKIGDKIRRKEPRSFDKDMQIARIEKDYYICNHIGKFSSEVVPFSKENGYELIEQKPINKVEPKFKVGDWVVSNKKLYVYQIEEINDFVVKVNENGESFVVDVKCLNDAHLWTIQDAKDGDVLYHRGEISLYKHDIKDCTRRETTIAGFVYHCCYDNKRFITDSLYSTTEDFYPATKEQRDLLFQKMKEAGYEWDDEKKELKKIEDEPKNYKQQLMSEMTDLVKDYIRQKPAWSEEDEKYAKDLVDYFTEGLSLKHTEENVANWLKSLKGRYTWKPSNEQVEAIRVARSFVTDDFGENPTLSDTLVELEEQLKALKL